MESDNIGRILSLLQLQRSLHQNEIAQELRLEKSTVSRIFKNLKERKLVQKTGEELPASPSGGRKGQLWQLKPEGAFAIGIDFDVEVMRIALINFHGIVLENSEFKNPKSKDEKSILSFFIKRIHQFIRKKQVDLKKVLGIAMGLPGLVSSMDGIAISAVNLPGWRDVHLRDFLSQEFNLPIFIDNGLRYTALAEQWLGLGKNRSHFLCVSMRYGIGMIPVIQGKVLRGAFEQAGDIHIALDPLGPECHCGRKGCLEALASPRAMMSQYYVEREDDQYNQFFQDISTYPDRFSNLLSKSSQYLGLGISYLAELFDPECILLSGILPEVYPKYVGMVRDAYKEHYLKDRRFEAPDLMLSELNLWSVCVGAGLTIFEHTFNMKAIISK